MLVLKYTTICTDFVGDTVATAPSGSGKTSTVTSGSVLIAAPMMTITMYWKFEQPSFITGTDEIVIPSALYAD